MIPTSFRCRSPLTGRHTRGDCVRVPPRKLSRYRAKRDFTRTTEPSGSGRSAATPRSRRYVIQKHAARRLHYDLRLEFGGVFKSWAVTKGPSLDPHDKRLAVEVEDHPLDYGDFEGTIPKGEYGGGTVQLWDRGTWIPEPGRSVQASLKSGELKFTLLGERLKGGWVLVRMKHDRTGGKRNNWLLIKHRDRFAKRRPAMRCSGPIARSRAGARWRRSRAGKAAQARRRKDRRPRAERSAARIHAPQLAKLVERAPAGSGWGHEIKFDGYRMQMRVVEGAVTLKTRNGLDWTGRFPEIARTGQALPDCLIDGEIVAQDKRNVPSFSRLQAALSEQRTAGLVYFVFDLLFADGVDYRGEALTERKSRLNNLLRKSRGHRMRYVEHFETAPEAILRSACRMALEGVISKRLDAPYRSGRGESWLKTKCRAGQEVVIGGWTVRSGRLRSLLVGVHRGKHLAYVGRVGTGFGERAVKPLLKRLRGLATERSPFSGENAPAASSDIRWVRPELVAEIEFAGWTGSGMVRQAAFKGLREDKPPADIGDEPVLRVGAAKKGRNEASRTRGRTDEVMVQGVAITNADKALWPHAGDRRPVTKEDLARYDAAIGPWMVEHLKGRPCSIIRAPDGIGGQRFFQRHAMQGTSSLIDLAKVKGERRPYLQLNRVEAVVAVAQSGGIELHPWNNKPGEPDVPGRFVFDLDPAPDVDFARVLEAARELRERLERLGLVPFCKTTGGKGLHVVTPLAQPRRGRLAWPEAKDYARAVCAEMAADSPDRYVITMSKQARVGRIFLDYLRNGHKATAVAPLSPRAREGATVSMPIDWGQVRAGLDPARYTVRTAPALLAKQMPWSDYAKGARPLNAIRTRKRP